LKKNIKNKIPKAPDKFDKKSSLSFIFRARCKYCGKTPKSWSFSYHYNGFKNISTSRQFSQYLNSLTKRMCGENPSTDFTYHNDRIKSLKYMKHPHSTYRHANRRMNINYSNCYIEYMGCDCFNFEWAYTSGKYSNFPEIKNRKI